MTIARLFGFVVLIGAAVSASSEPAAEPIRDPVALTRQLNESFRIDLSTIDVVYDLDPAAATIDGRATLTFTMRPDQNRALFHFAPQVDRGGSVRETLRTIRLDGAALDPQSEDDVRVIRFEGSRQDAFELQRDLSGNVSHTLVIEWTIWNVFLDDHEAGWFRTLVDDTIGLGNEALWPTINSPEELARHRIDVRIHDEREYLMIGSGIVSSRSEEGVQVWSLDTEREISS